MLKINQQCDQHQQKLFDLLFAPLPFFTIHPSLHAFWEVVERNAIQALMGEEKPSADKGNQKQMGNDLAT